MLLFDLNSLLLLVFPSFSHGQKDFVIEDRAVNGGPRWRSDETSDEDDDPSPERALGITHRSTPMRGVRRSRFAKR